MNATAERTLWGGGGAAEDPAPRAHVLLIYRTQLPTHI